MRPITTRQLAVDVVPVALVSAGVVLFAESPAAMWVLLVLALAGRFVAWRLAHPGRSLAVELAFFVLCTLVGAANDFNTVVVHEVYAYTAPAELPGFSTIPIWMLVFWGLILRLVFALTRWEALGPPAAPRSPALGRLLLIAAVVIATRLCVYSWGRDPILSWSPFALALAAFALAGRADRHDAKLAVIALVVGPLLEAFYIRVGHLHRYPLGWVLGVPVWIVLWWALATWIWKDLGLRLYARLERYFAAELDPLGRRVR